MAGAYWLKPVLKIALAMFPEFGDHEHKNESRMFSTTIVHR